MGKKITEVPKAKWRSSGVNCADGKSQLAEFELMVDLILGKRIIDVSYGN